MEEYYARGRTRILRGSSSPYRWSSDNVKSIAVSGPSFLRVVEYRSRTMHGHEVSGFFEGRHTTYSHGPSVGHLYTVRFPPTPSTRIRIDAGGAQLPKGGATPPLACSLQRDLFFRPRRWRWRRVILHVW